MLAPTDGEAGDIFGYCVALAADGTRALIGARLDDNAAGVDAGIVSDVRAPSDAGRADVTGYRGRSVSSPAPAGS